MGIISYAYSKHFKKRMLERNFSEEDVVKILSEEVPVKKIKSDRDPEIDLIMAKLENRFIVVLINRTTNVCVTVRNLREKEKLFFESGESK
jgi:hypothetical protein